MKSVLGCLCLFLSVLAAPAMAAPQLHIPQINAAAGSVVVVPVFLADANQLSAVDFSIDYDESVLTPASQPFLRGDLLKGHTVGIGEDSGTATLLIYSSSLETFGSNSGILVQLVFRVSAGAQGGTTALEVRDLKGLSSQGSPIDVSASDGSVAVNSESNAPEPGENRQVFAQVANGSFTGGSFDVRTFFVNRTSARATGRIQFFKEDGEPLSVGLTDGRRGSEFSFALAPGGSNLLQTDGQGTFGVGYAVLTSSAPLGGTLLFALHSPGGGTLAEAGVGSSVESAHFSIPVLFQAHSSDTGIAFANPSSETANLTLLLKDAEGRAVQTVDDQSLAPGAHLARFSKEFFESTLGSLTEFHGSIEVISSAPIFAVALKQQGALLTTFPVVTLP